MAEASQALASGDQRWIKFRETYTIPEHLLTIEEGQERQLTVTTQLIDAVQRLTGDLRSQHAYLSQQLTHGFESLTNELHWGFAEIAHQLELQREIYQRMLEALRYPAANAGREYRERAEKALENGWWDRLRPNLEVALDHYPEDFLAHLHLAYHYWFHEHRWDLALHHYREAARFADAKGATPQQQYYAAVAYTHVSMLERMNGLTLPTLDEKIASLHLANDAAVRALGLQPELQLAALEFTVNCIGLSRYVSSGEREVLHTKTQACIRSCARRDKGRLMAYLRHPELGGAPEIAEWVADAESTIVSVAEEQAEARRREAESVRERADAALQKAKAARQEAEAARWNARREAELGRQREALQRATGLAAGCGVTATVWWLLISVVFNGRDSVMLFLPLALTVVACASAWRAIGINRQIRVKRPDL